MKFCLDNIFCLDFEKLYLNIKWLSTYEDWSIGLWEKKPKGFLFNLMHFILQNILFQYLFRKSTNKQLQYNNINSSMSQKSIKIKPTVETLAINCWFDKEAIFTCSIEI